jgi:hypothetical protein
MMRRFVCRRVVASAGSTFSGSSRSSGAATVAAAAATRSTRHFSSSDAGSSRSDDATTTTNITPAVAGSGEIEDEKGFRSFAVDRSGLAKGMEEEDFDEFDLAVEGKEEPTDLARDLNAHIKMKGPISLHDYMAQAANHSLFGYYQVRAMFTAYLLSSSHLSTSLLPFIASLRLSTFLHYQVRAVFTAYLLCHLYHLSSSSLHLSPPSVVLCFSPSLLFSTPSPL